jgi:hypothetical protein
MKRKFILQTILRGVAAVSLAALWFVNPSLNAGPPTCADGAYVAYGMCYGYCHGLGAPNGGGPSASCLAGCASDLNSALCGCGDPMFCPSGGGGQ